MRMLRKSLVIGLPILLSVAVIALVQAAAAGSGQSCPVTGAGSGAGDGCSPCGKVCPVSGQPSKSPCPATPCCSPTMECHRKSGPAAGKACPVTGACGAVDPKAGTPAVGSVPSQPSGDPTTHPVGINISTETLKALIDAKTPMFVLDARSGKYDDGFRLPGARQLSSDASEEEIKARVPARRALVITYCANPKCPASARLAKRLHELGYVNVLEYPWGIDGWRAAGLPVESTR